MRRLALLATLAIVMVACGGQRYEPTFGHLLETVYANKVPESQQRLLADGELTISELEQATEASNACAAAVPGIESVEPYLWVELEGDFDGGEIEYAANTDEAGRKVALADARVCYIEHMGLIEYAWLDQFYFGEWTEENLRR